MLRRSSVNFVTWRYNGYHGILGKYTRVGRYAAANLCAQNSLHKRALSKIERDIYSHGVARRKVIGLLNVLRRSTSSPLYRISRREQSSLWPFERIYIWNFAPLVIQGARGAFTRRCSNTIDRPIVVIMGLLSERDVWLEKLVPSFIEGHRYIEIELISGSIIV